MIRISRAALAASLFINGACVAWLGASELLHPKTAASAPKPVSSSNLHAVAIAMASQDALEGYGRDQDGTGDDAQNAYRAGSKMRSAAGGSGIGGTTGRNGLAGPTRDGQTDEVRDTPQSKSNGRDTESERGTLSSRVRESDNGSRNEEPRRAQQLHSPVKRSSTVATNPRDDKIESHSMRPRASRSGNRTGSASLRPVVPGGNLASPLKAADIKVASTNVGAPSGGISPVMHPMPKMKIDLGVVHETRPKHGVVGGGYADMRNVDITAHYVIDDPNNVPKKLEPDKNLHLFKSRCVADPGNTSKSVLTGGNTRLGGTTLHGHDHITGVKYCVPGAGGLPGQGTHAGQMGHGGRFNGSDSDARIHGTLSSFGGGSPAIRGMPDRGMPGGGPTELHLPDGPSDDRGLIPGARVPEEDRKLVADPLPSTAPSPKEVKMALSEPFTIRIKNVGSLSENGSVDWGKPQKVTQRKRHLGGDGTGLLGQYYLGANYETFAFRRPDRNVDFDFIANPPNPEMPPGTDFSVHWTGSLVPDHTDDYTILATSDDGERVYIDDHVIISNWSIHAVEEDMATVHLEAGHVYKFKFDYFEANAGSAVAMLYWFGPHTPREYIPESVFRYPTD